jgi:hypothetical protein
METTSGFVFGKIMRLEISMSYRACAMALLSVTGALAQVPQDRPELCGKPNQAVPLPRGTDFVWTPTTAELRLSLKDGTSKTIDLEQADTVPQVCPIDGDRLLVFGTVRGEDGPFVWIISRKDGTKLDLLGSRSPVVSPDQQWIVYRHFYPRRSEILTESYLLYHLSEDPAANRLPAEVPGETNPPGRQIYPVTADHAPFNNILYDPKRVHAFASESFYWSPDSKYLAFADRLVNGETDIASIVMVRVGTKDLATYVHELNTKEMCGGAEPNPNIAATATLHGAEFGLGQGGLPELSARFFPYERQSAINPACTAPVQLRSPDLKPAEIEIHDKPVRR